MERQNLRRETLSGEDVNIRGVYLSMDDKGERVGCSGCSNSLQRCRGLGITQRKDHGVM